MRILSTAYFSAPCSLHFSIIRMSFNCYSKNLLRYFALCSIMETTPGRKNKKISRSCTTSREVSELGKIQRIFLQKDRFLILKFACLHKKRPSKATPRKIAFFVFRHIFRFYFNNSYHSATVVLDGSCVPKQAYSLPKSLYFSSPSL